MPELQKKNFAKNFELILNDKNYENSKLLFSLCKCIKGFFY